MTFSQQYLPQYFKHSNWGSFVRQLNLYGFSSSRSRDNADVQVWRHDYFHRDKKEAVAKIKRSKRNKNSSSQSQSSNPNNSNGVSASNTGISNHFACNNSPGDVRESPPPGHGGESQNNGGSDSPALSEGGYSSNQSDGHNLKISPSDHEWLDAEFTYLKQQNKLLEQKLDTLLKFAFDRSNVNSFGVVVERMSGEGNRKRRKVTRVGTTYPSHGNSNRDRPPLFRRNLQQPSFQHDIEPVPIDNYPNSSFPQQQRPFCPSHPFHGQPSSKPSTGAKNTEDHDFIALIDNVLHEDQGFAMEGGKSLDDCDSSINGPSIPSIDCMSAVSENDDVNVPAVPELYQGFACENGNHGLNRRSYNLNSNNRSFTGGAPEAPQWIPRSLYNMVKLAGPDPVPAGVHIVDPDEEQGDVVNVDDIANENHHACDARVDHVPAEVTIVSAHLVQDNPDIQVSGGVIFPSHDHRHQVRGRFYKHRKTIILGIVGAVACAAFISIPIVVLDRDDNMHANIQEDLNSVFQSEKGEKHDFEGSDDFLRDESKSSESDVSLSELEGSDFDNDSVSIAKNRSGPKNIKSGSIVAENGIRSSSGGIGRDGPMGELEWNESLSRDGDQDVQNDRNFSPSNPSFLGLDDVQVVHQGEAAFTGYTHENFDVNLNHFETQYNSTLPPPVPPSFDDADQDFWTGGRHGDLFTERGRSDGASIGEVIVSIGEEQYFCTQSYTGRLIR